LSSGTLAFRVLHEFPATREERAWRECLLRSDWASHYTSPEFFREPFWVGKRPFAILAVDGERVIAVLTGIHEAGSLVCGNTCRPQLCFDRSASQEAAIDALARGLAAERGSDQLVALYTWSPAGAFEKHGFRSRTYEGSVVLDLKLGSEHHFARLHPNRRRNVRYAEKHGVEVSQATTREEFLEYYEVYQRWRRTARKLIVGESVPLETYEQAMSLSANRLLFLARYQGRIIAGDVIRFCPGGLVEASANSSCDEYLHLKPNDLLVWKAIDWACRNGFPRMSMGGAHHFLREYGGTLTPIHRARRDFSLMRRHDLEERLLEAGQRWVRRSPVIHRVAKALLRQPSVRTRA
jgi:hypothetical protein